MAKKDKKIAQIDFHTGIGRIIPSTQEAYTEDDFSSSAKKIEKEELTQFKKIIGGQIDKELKESKQFPSDNEVFVFIVQYFISRT